MAPKPIIYQLLPRLYGNINSKCVPNGDIDQNGCGKLADITSARLGKLRKLGITHLWLTGIIEHATQTDYSESGLLPGDAPEIVKGKAGSPYAIRDYYDIDADLAVTPEKRMQEFDRLISRIHREGLKVIIDFVPNHTARNYHSDNAPKGCEDFGSKDDCNLSFSPKNDYYYLVNEAFGTPKGESAYKEFPAKASGNDCFTASPGTNDWYETVKLNYGYNPSTGQLITQPEPVVWDKMINILRFWASKGVDGFRCDMVHMVPIEFWHKAIAEIKQQYPEIKFMGEIYDPRLYHPYIFNAGFDYLYDKVGLYDSLRAIETEKSPTSRITQAWQSVDGIGHHMVSFLENHDEQRFHSDFYAGENGKILPSLVIAATLSTGPVLIYAGQEYGEQGMDAEGFSGCDGRTTIFDYWSIPSLRRALTGHLALREKEIFKVHEKVLTLCNQLPAIQIGNFFDLMYVNPALAQHQFAFLRSTSDQTLLIVTNFDDIPVTIDINIPAHAFSTLQLQQLPECNLEDLLTGEKSHSSFTSSSPVKVNLEAHGAKILLINS